MSSYNSSRELAIKMASEGGLADLMFGYGLDEDDLPEDMDGEIFEKILGLLKMGPVYDEVQTWLYARMEDDPSPGDWDYEEPYGANDY